MVPTLRPRARHSLRLTPETPPPLPTDVLIEILKRLPLKSLVRFVCICKSWYSLLTSPTFIATLSAFNLKKSQKFLLFKESVNIHLKSRTLKFMAYNLNSTIKQGTIDCPIGRNHFVVCSVDGLVCLYNFYAGNPVQTPLVLWNPSIKKAIIAHVPYRGGLEFTCGGFPKCIFGAGYDSGSDSYKVVRIAYFDAKINGTAFRADVYSVGDDKWKNLGMIVISEKVTTIRWRGVNLNGVIHWICNAEKKVNSDNNGDQVYRFILTFKLGNDEFGVISVPKELMYTPYGTMNRLRVVTVPRGGKEVLGVIQNKDRDFSLWMMENCAVNEPWVKLLNTNFLTRIMNDMNVLIISDSDVLVLVENAGWIWYDHTTREFFYLRGALPENLDYVDAYIESLILVNHRRRVIQCKEKVRVQVQPVRVQPVQVQEEEEEEEEEEDEQQQQRRRLQELFPPRRHINRSRRSRAL